jgi:hypothetical protein
MPITKKIPLVIPAKVEKTLPHTWISELVVNVSSISEAYMFLKLTPYNSDSDEDPDLKNSETMHLDFWDVVANVPEAAAAMQAVFDAVPAIETYYKKGLLGEIPIEEIPIEEIPIEEEIVEEIPIEEEIVEEIPIEEEIVER